MLPKVSAALSKFVTPIQTTSGSSSAREKEFVRTQPEKKAKVIQLRGQNSKDQSPGEQQHPEDPGPETHVSNPDTLPPKGGDHLLATRRDLGSSFLSLFASLRQNSGSIFKWIGVNGYRLGMKATRRGGRLRKGAMLDVKVD